MENEHLVEWGIRHIHRAEISQFINHNKLRFAGLEGPKS